MSLTVVKNGVTKVPVASGPAGCRTMQNLVAAEKWAQEQAALNPPARPSDPVAVVLQELRTNITRHRPTCLRCVEIERSRFPGFGFSLTKYAGGKR
jgi:hypothetical protein